MFKIQDVDLLEKIKEGLSNGPWGNMEDIDPGSRRARGRKQLHTSSRQLCTVRMAWWQPRLLPLGRLRQSSGMWDLLATIAEVRYSPFYTYVYTYACDLAFEALVDTLHRFQHIITKLMMYCQGEVQWG